MKQRSTSAAMAVIAFLFWGPVRPAAEPLSLIDAVREAVEKSPDVRRAATEIQIAAYEEPNLLALTDPVFNVRASEESDRAPRAAPAIEGPFRKTRNLDVSLRQNWLIGTEAEIFFNTERVDSPATFRPVNPTVNSRLGIAIEQPLLRTFWGRPDIARRRQARALVAAARERLKRQQERAAAQTALTYINAWLAAESVRVRQDFVTDARRLREKNEEKSRYGLVERSEYLQATAALRTQETELELARSRFVERRNALDAELQRATLIESTGSLSLPALPPQPIPSIDEAVQVAFAERGDYRAAQEDVRRAEFFVRAEKLDTLPKLNAFGSYASAGLGQNRRDAWDGAESFDDEVVSGGVEFEIPLAFRKERLRRREARSRLELAQAEVAELGREIRLEVSDALERLRLARERRRMYAELARIQRQKLSSEMENFRRGKSSTDLLIRFQDDIRNAEVLKLQSDADELSAWAALAYATGRLTESLEMLAKAQP